MKMAFSSCWFDHVVHLAKQVNEQNRLVVEIFKSVQLFLVEVVHFLGRYYLVVIEIYHFEPVVQRLNCAFVLLTKHEVYKVFVPHFTWLLSFELSRHLVKDAVNCCAT